MDIPLRTYPITVEPEHYANRPAEERRRYRVAVADTPLRLAIQKAVLEEAGEPVTDEDLAGMMEDAARDVFTSEAERERAFATIADWLAEDELRRAALLRGEKAAADDALARRFYRLRGVLSGYSELLRRGLVQKIAHGRAQIVLTLGFCLHGWEGPGLPAFERHGNQVPQALIERAFEQGDDAARLDAHLLFIEAWRGMTLSALEKKTSDSP